MISNITESKLELMAARQILASALASAFSDPRSLLALRCDGSDLEIVGEAWLEIQRESAGFAASGLGLGERLPKSVDIEPLIGWLALSTARRERVHQLIFGIVMTKLCPSYETEYCSWKDATHRAQEMADIGGFYNAFGVQPNRAAPERMDHVSLEIEFLALLIEKERVAELSAEENTSDCIDVCRSARQSFVRDHAGWWMPTFGRLLEKRANLLCESDPEMVNDLRKVAGVARILCAWIAVERILTDVAPSRRIISPSVAPQETDDDCGSCGSCSQEVAR